MYAKAFSWLAIVTLVSSAPAADPPVLKELSPSPKVIPRPTDPIPVDVGKYRFFSVEGYAGTSVTWEVDGTSVGIKEVATPVTLFGLVQGQPEPGEYPVPAGAVIVWGVNAGETRVVAYGVVDGKAKRLLSMVFTTGPPPDVEPIPKPKPVPVPVAGKLFGWVMIEDLAVPFANRGLTLNAAVAWSGTNGISHRTAGKNVVDASGKPPADMVPYLTRAAGKPVPQLFLITADGKLLYEGPAPTGADAPAAFIALLEKYKGK